MELDQLAWIESVFFCFCFGVNAIAYLWICECACINLQTILKKISFFFYGYWSDSCNEFKYTPHTRMGHSKRRMKEMERIWLVFFFFWLLYWIYFFICIIFGLKKMYFVPAALKVSKVLVCVCVWVQIVRVVVCFYAFCFETNESRFVMWIVIKLWIDFRTSDTCMCDDRFFFFRIWWKYYFTAWIAGIHCDLVLFGWSTYQ